MALGKTTTVICTIEEDAIILYNVMSHNKILSY